MKKVIIAIAIIAALLAALILFRNMFIKAVLVNGVKSVTGLVVEIGGVDIGFPQTAAAIKGLKVYSPKDFNDRLMADVPEIYVDYDLGAFFKNKVHFEELRININELNIMRKEKIKVNLAALALLLPKPTGGRPPELKIDRLALRIGKIVYEDYSFGGEPKKIELSININETFENVSDPSKIAASVTNNLFSSVGLGDIVSEIRQQGQDAVSGAVGKVGEALVGAIGVADDTVKSATDELKDIFKPSK